MYCLAVLCKILFPSILDRDSVGTCLMTERTGVKWILRDSEETCLFKVNANKLDIIIVNPTSMGQ